jgi:hypothetical protein
VFPLFFFRQYAFIRAETLALAAALIFDFFAAALVAGLPAFALRVFAHRARCAAAIFLRAEALTDRRSFGAAAVRELPSMLLSSFASAAIWSLMAAARFSCCDVRSIRFMATLKLQRK